jgi:hypothetical protein
MKFRLRFIIRDLLWLTLVAAVLVLWWLDHRRLSDIIADLTPPPLRSLSSPSPNTLQRPISSGTLIVGEKARSRAEETIGKWLKPNEIPIPITKGIPPAISGEDEEMKILKERIDDLTH